METVRNKIAQTLLGAGLMLWLGSAGAPPHAAAASAAGADTVRGLYDALLANMQSGAALGARGRYARIEPVVRGAFNMQFMARLAVGPEWERLAEAQRRQVAEAFERYIAAIYAERFDSYAGERSIRARFIGGTILHRYVKG